MIFEFSPLSVPVSRARVNYPGLGRIAGTLDNDGCYPLARFAAMLAFLPEPKADDEPIE